VTGNLAASVADVGATSHFNALTTFTYNGIGQTLTATDLLGTVTQYGYDSFGNRTSVTRDSGNSNHLNQVQYPAW
jgi:YD repeat-containing protein